MLFRNQKFIHLSLSLLTLFPDFSFAQKSWRDTDQSSAGIAPLPEEEPRAVVQIYYARAYSWRGYFGVHPWVAIKEKDATSFTVYEVVGFRREEVLPVIRKTLKEPDRKWFGNSPELLFDLRGSAAEKMIPDIERAVASYPYPESYRVWPGPNSNTFVSHIIRHTPGISAELPPQAIGKDWIGKGQPLGISETGTGFQFSLFGLLGFTVGIGEGIEINILGLTFGIDFLRPALKLPIVGRLGFKDAPVFKPKGDSENSFSNSSSSLSQYP